MPDMSDRQEDVLSDLEEEAASLNRSEDSRCARNELNDAAIQKYSKVHEDEFEELWLPGGVAEEMRQCWQAFLAKYAAAELAGLAIYDAIFEDAPNLRSMFKSPRTVFALTFTNFLSNILSMTSNPSTLRSSVETLGLQHLDREVTPARLAVFSGAVLTSMDAELGHEFTPDARAGIVAMLNYIGGAMVYCRREFGTRVKIIQRSWKIATHHQTEVPSESEDIEQEPMSSSEQQQTEGKEDAEASSEKRKAKDKSDDTARLEVKVPTTFHEMFLFNVAVMGCADCKWMHILLERFDAMATNVASTTRLQEECDVLSLRLAKYNGQVVLPQFKAVMLASLRSMVPKDWDMDHEVAWTWFWENMEKLLKKMMGMPQAYNKVLKNLLSNLDEASISRTRQVVFERFFELAPDAENFMKQSSTRMYYIADKVMEMTIDIYDNPQKLVDDISGLGLRHVGYGVPSEYFPPMVQAYCEAIDNLSPRSSAAFRWSLTLITKILTRVILEGSTVVMRAINTNQESAVRQAVAVAPRGKRAMSVLSISVGTQTISPLYWAIDSGRLNCAKAIIEDLLTIRADRDVYYYGCEALFTRHPEIVQKMCVSAPSLLIALLEGLVWRSRITKDGSRRVNLYIKHLVQDSKGAFSPTLHWLVRYKDPKIMSHLVVALTTDLIWSRFAAFQFLRNKFWFLLTLGIFFVSQSILKEQTGVEEVFEANVARFVLRLWLYLAGMCGLYSVVKNVASEYSCGQVIRTSTIRTIHIPRSMTDAKQIGRLALVWVLMAMLAFEPILRCASTMDSQNQYLLFTSRCGVEEEIRIYSMFSAIGMVLFWLLLTDCTVFSMRLSAFMLVCGWVAAEVCLFLLALLFLILTFSTALSSLQHDLEEFNDTTTWVSALAQMVLGMFPASDFSATQQDLPIFVCLTFFMALVSILLMNLLIAQLVESYRAMFADIIGFARLNRASVVVSVLAEAHPARFARFLRTLHFEDRLEFNEGDSGPAGGIQIQEPANEHTVTEDSILRYGGPTAPSVPWPEDERKAEESAEEKLQHVANRLGSMEKLLSKMAKSQGMNLKNGSRLSASMISKSTCSMSTCSDPHQ